MTNDPDLYSFQRMSQESKEIDIFLSHSSVDKPWVRELATRLEQESIDTRKVRVFLDEWDIAVGQNIVQRLNEGLQKSRQIAVIMSPEMIGSDWCSAEVSSFLMADPLNRQGRIVPIRLRDLDSTGQHRLVIPPVLTPLKWLDFRKDKDSDKEYAQLIAHIRGEAPPRGARDTANRGATPLAGLQVSSLRQEPDPITEVLVSNLLRVKIPTSIWSAPTMLTSKRDVHEFYKYPAFIVREKRLFSFVDLSKDGNAFAPFLLQGKRERLNFEEWKQSPDKWRWAVELLNDTLRSYLWNQGIRYIKKSDRYMFRPRGSKSVYVRWGSGTKRKVVFAPEQGGRWVHQAASLHFELLGDQVSLSIEPYWMFTVDGHTPVPRVETAPLSMQWNGIERNGAILRHTLMWSDAITSGRDFVNIPAGGEVLKIERLPKTAQVTKGIAGDRVAVRALLQFSDEEKRLALDTFGYIESEKEALDEEKENVETEEPR